MAGLLVTLTVTADLVQQPVAVMLKGLTLLTGLGLPKFGPEPQFKPQTPKPDLKFWFGPVLVLSSEGRFGSWFYPFYTGSNGFKLTLVAGC